MGGNDDWSADIEESSITSSTPLVFSNESVMLGSNEVFDNCLVTVLVGNCSKCRITY